MLSLTLRCWRRGGSVPVHQQLLHADSERPEAAAVAGLGDTDSVGQQLYSALDFHGRTEARTPD